jgi:cell division protein FtsQ
MTAPVTPAVPVRRWRWRLLSAGATMVVASLVAGGAWQGYRMVLGQPLKRVAFRGDVDRLPRASLDALERSVAGAGPEGATLEAVRAAARRVPWVREATVRRVYPDVAEVTFEAHRALARWNDNSLLSPAGEVFVAETSAELPRLRGPDSAAADMARELPAMTALLLPLGTPLAELRLSARGAWQALLASGLVLELGRGDIDARARRFAAAWSLLKSQGVETKHADLRHANGFALRRAADLSATPAAGAGARKK